LRRSSTATSGERRTRLAREDGRRACQRNACSRCPGPSLLRRGRASRAASRRIRHARVPRGRARRKTPESQPRRRERRGTCCSCVSMLLGAPPRYRERKSRRRRRPAGGSMSLTLVPSARNVQPQRNSKSVVHRRQLQPATSTTTRHVQGNYLAVEVHRHSLASTSPKDYLCSSYST
jgi:hypothetical protein